MTLESVNWDEDLSSNPEEEYQALVRTLRRKNGFGLFFVRCSPAEGDRLFARVKTDLFQKKLEFLQFEKPIDNLYEIVANLPNREQINILFIQGLKYSFYAYENLNFSENSDRYNYNWKGVPQILNHLNQQRERFRDDFNNICFVFLLRSFSIKYFIRRAPDFFDWRSGIFEFSTVRRTVEQELSRILSEGDYQKYLDLTPEERIQKIITIQELLEEDFHIPTDKAYLHVVVGNLLSAENESERAIASFDQALKIYPDDDNTWINRGIALRNLGRYKEALASFDQALKIYPNSNFAWVARGIVLDDLGRYERAIASFDQALKIYPDDDNAWIARSMALRHLERYEEAILSYNRALQINPCDDITWLFRGMALRKLERYKEAIASFDQALELNPNKDSAWYIKACCYALQGNLEQAIENLQRAIELNPEKYCQMAKTDSDFDSIREDERFEKLIQGISEEN